MNLFLKITSLVLITYSSLTSAQENPSFTQEQIIAQFRDQHAARNLDYSVSDSLTLPVSLSTPEEAATEINQEVCAEVYEEIKDFYHGHDILNESIGNTQNHGFECEEWSLSTGMTYVPQHFFLSTTTATQTLLGREYSRLLEIHANLYFDGNVNGRTGKSIVMQYFISPNNEIVSTQSLQFDLRTGDAVAQWLSSLSAAQVFHVKGWKVRNAHNPRSARVDYLSFARSNGQRSYFEFEENSAGQKFNRMELSLLPLQENWQHFYAVNSFFYYNDLPQKDPRFAIKLYSLDGEANGEICQQTFQIEDNTETYKGRTCDSEIPAWFY